MSIADIQASAQARMAKSLEQLKTNLAKIRTGRAHPGILDHVQVEYYGSPVPISQVANVNLMDARTLSVQVWEKNMAGAVEKAIRGMLPKNSLGADQFRKLKVYAGAEHPHTAQQPKPYTFDQVAQ